MGRKKKQKKEPPMRKKKPMGGNKKKGDNEDGKIEVVRRKSPRFSNVSNASESVDEGA